MLESVFPTTYLLRNIGIEIMTLRAAADGRKIILMQRCWPWRADFSLSFCHPHAKSNSSLVSTSEFL